jgi:hypothetical protein
MPETQVIAMDQFLVILNMTKRKIVDSKSQLLETIDSQREGFEDNSQREGFEDNSQREGLNQTKTAIVIANFMPSNLTLKAVKGVIVMDSEGNVLVSKYYDQTVSEKNLFEKTRKSTGDIIMYENMIVIYRPVVDLVFYLLGGVDENEVMLQGALNAFIDALTILLKFPILT